MTVPYTTNLREDTGLYNGKVGMWLFLASEVMLFGALFSGYVYLRVVAREGNWPHGLLNVPLGALNTLVLITSSLTVALSWTSLKMGDFKRFRRFMLATMLCSFGFLAIKSVEYHDKFHHYEIWLKEPLAVKDFPQLADQSASTEADAMVPSITGHIEGAGLFENLASLTEAGAKTLTIHPDKFHYRLSAHQQAERLKAERAGQAAHAEGEGHAGVTVDVSRISRVSAFVPAHSTYFANYFTLTGLHALHVTGGLLTFAFLVGPGARMWRDDPVRYTNRIEVSGLFWHFVDLVWIFLFPILYLL